VQYHRRASIILQARDLDIAQLDVLGVPDVEPMRWHPAEHAWLRIRFLILRRIDRRVFLSAAALMLDVDVANLHVLDQVPRNAADDRADSRSRIRAHNIADQYAAQLTYGYSRRSAHPPAEPQEDRASDDVAHRNVRNGHVFEQSAVD